MRRCVRYRGERGLITSSASEKEKLETSMATVVV